MAEVDDLRAACAAKLDTQASRAREFQDYYEGEQGVIALLDTEERRTFKTFLDESGANWCELIVNAVAERLQVVGFRFGDDQASEAAWTIWQANQMDADSELVQTDALVMGSSFVLVQPDEDNPTGVAITAESPLQATVLYQPGNRRRRLAGYKRFPEVPGEPGRNIEVLITPEEIITWNPWEIGPEVYPNPAGTVGLIELVPQPRTVGWPRSELAPAVAIQDRIQTILFNRCVAMDYGAFRQIWATGIKIARDVIRTADGGEVVKVTRPFDIGANRLLTNENDGGKFGAFQESTLGGYLASVEQDVTMLAAITQTPAHYLTGHLVNLSADAIKAAETGLVAKVRRRSLHFGEGYEEAMRLALQLAGNPAAVDTSAEVIWADFETRSEGQRVDALVKMATLGVPREVLWQRWGATPQEIERWEGMLADEQAAAPPAPEPAPEGAPAA
jgi:Phage portal protein, SPP1 Gp6-like